MSDETRPTERPATFREVFASKEYRAIFTAFSLSWFGDYLAKAAVTTLVYERTDSVALSAATFALSFLPWVVGGPLLATLADRHRYRSVMVVCDVLRMLTIGLVVIPGMPVWGMLTLLFLTTLVSPPAQAAKSALMPVILTGDRLVVGLALNSSSSQAAQVGGYVAGAALAPFHPELALLGNAAAFGLSALLLRSGLADRPPASTPTQRRHLMRETGEGFSLVFGTPVLRAIAVLVFAMMLFSIVPEGLAAAWAADLTADDAERGASQAMIMAANPVGFVLGGLLISRLVSPQRRQRLVRPFAVLAPASLVPALLHPSAITVAAMAAVCGFAVAGLLPTANGLFVQALPHGYRARAFGVMQSGLQVIQGLAVVVTGLLADAFNVPDVVGVWSLLGVALMLLLSARWPSPQRFAEAIAEAARSSAPAAAQEQGPKGSGPPAVEPHGSGLRGGPASLPPSASFPPPADWSPGSPLPHRRPGESLSGRFRSGQPTAVGRVRPFPPPAEPAIGGPPFGPAVPATYDPGRRLPGPLPGSTGPPEWPPRLAPAEPAPAEPAPGGAWTDPEHAGDPGDWRGRNDATGQRRAGTLRTQGRRAQAPGGASAHPGPGDSLPARPTSPATGAAAGS